MARLLEGGAGARSTVEAGDAAWLRAACAAAGRDAAARAPGHPPRGRRHADPAGLPSARPGARGRRRAGRARRRRCRTLGRRVRWPSMASPVPASPASSPSTSRRPSPPSTRWRPSWACRPASSRRHGCSRRPTRLSTRSELVFRETGCWGVAEGAALAAVGAGGPAAGTQAEGRSGSPAPWPSAPAELDPADDRPAAGPARGRRPRPRRPRVAHRRGASACSAEAEELVGYGLYLDLIGPGRCRQAAPRVPARRRGGALPLRPRARRRGPQRRPGLLGRSRHLRAGDAGVRAARERRPIRPGRASRSRSAPASRHCRRRPPAPAPRSATISAPSRCRTC